MTLKTLLRRVLLRRTLLLFSLSLFLTLNHCALFKGKRTLNDPLIDFYKNEPPKHTLASLRLTEKGRGQIDEGDKEIAMESLNKALSIDPINPFAYYFLAKIHSDRHEHRESLGLLEKTRQYSTKFPFWKAQSHLLSAFNCRALGLSKQMNFHLKKAKEFDPEIDLDDID